MKHFVILSIVLLSSICASAQDLPNVSQYPAKVEQATVRDIDLASNPKAKDFETNLEDALASGVNFAGHFIFAQWGCGSGCVQRSEEHTSELQSLRHLVCRLLL